MDTLIAYTFCVLLGLVIMLVFVSYDSFRYISLVAVTLGLL